MTTLFYHKARNPRKVLIYLSPSWFTLNKMKTQTKIIIGAILVILILGGYILDDKVIKPHYQEQGIAAVINQINSNGNIPIINNGTVQWIGLQQICQGS